MALQQDGALCQSFASQRVDAVFVSVISRKSVQKRLPRRPEDLYIMAKKKKSSGSNPKVVASSKYGAKKTTTEPRKRTAKKKTTATSSASATERPKPDFPVVGIGASAGGLEALDELFQNMPANTGMAFVVLTHQHPGHTSLLPELLGKHTEMPVVEAADGTTLEPDHG